MNTKQISKTKSIVASFIMFVLVILAMIFAATPIQIHLGMVGVLITELILLAMAIIGVIIMKAPLKEVFPLGRPRIRQTIGTLVLWFATYLIVLFSTLVMGYLFPEGVSAVNTGLNSVISSVPFWARFLIVAVSPAICEEAVHRGFILHFLKPINKKWAIVLIMGILFGLFHMDPFRFLPTAILGGIITYVAIETKNMFYPFLIHFTNNFLSVIATKATENIDYSTVDPESAFSLMTVGAYLLIVCVVPWLFWLGFTLIHPKKEEKSKGTLKKVLISLAISIFCIVVGSILTISGVMANAVFNVSDMKTSAQIAAEPYSHAFDIENDGSQMLTMVVSSPQDELYITIMDENGDKAYETTTTDVTANISLNLSAGHYTLNVELANPETGSENPVVFNFVLQQI